MSDTDDDEGSRRLASFLHLWGFAEIMLDLCISTIYRDHDGRAITSQIPRSLEQRLIFLKTAYSTIPALAPFEPVALKAHDSFMADKDLRNIIVHAGPIKFEPNGTIYFLRTRIGFEGLKFDLRIVRPKDWDRLSHTCAALFAHLIVLLCGLSPGDRTFDHIKEASSESIVKLTAGFPGSKRLRQLLQEVLTGATGD